MKVVQITPGTGNFYCGVCVRDNALVSCLREQGHETLILPLYLPFVTEEPSRVEEGPLFFGGINVYLQQKSSFFRKTPRVIDRLLDNRFLLKWSAAMAEMTEAEELGEITLSTLRGLEGNQAKEILRLLDWLEDYGRPDVVCLGTGLLVSLARPIRERLKIPVVCTLQGEDSFLDSLPAPYDELAWKEIAERVKDVDRFIPVSHYFAGVMRDRLRIPEDKLHVVHNGIDLEGFPGSRRSGGPPVLGFLARQCPAKGLHRAAEVFALLVRKGTLPGLQFHVGGTMTPGDKDYVESIRAMLDEQGCLDRTRFRDNLSREEKIRFLSGVSVLSVPAVYGESFGLYLLEAWAAGVPVVQPRSGAFPELLEATGGGILTGDDSPEALAEAVEDLLLHPDQAESMGKQGQRAVFRRFHVERMAKEVFRVFEEAVSAY